MAIATATMRTRLARSTVTVCSPARQKMRVVLSAASERKHSDITKPISVASTAAHAGSTRIVPAANKIAVPSTTGAKPISASRLEVTTTSTSARASASGIEALSQTAIPATAATRARPTRRHMTINAAAPATWGGAPATANAAASNSAPIERTNGLPPASLEICQGKNSDRTIAINTPAVGAVVRTTGPNPWANAWAGSSKASTNNGSITWLLRILLTVILLFCSALFMGIPKNERQSWSG